ncbi:MAG: SsrA-binding protein SmpB [Saprospiraceae bacterium]
MAKKKDKNPNKKIEIINRKAKFEYKFLSEIEAGLILTGTEIKSIRAGEANIKEAYCLFLRDGLFIRNMFIAEYKYGTHNNHEVRRDRKLLLKKIELKKLQRKVKEKGMTIVPYRLFVNDRGFAKLDITLATGKRQYDKRATMKERDNKREMDRLKKIKL